MYRNQHSPTSSPSGCLINQQVRVWVIQMFGGLLALPPLISGEASAYRLAFSLVFLPLRKHTNIYLPFGLPWELSVWVPRLASLCVLVLVASDCLPLRSQRGARSPHQFHAGPAVYLTLCHVSRLTPLARHMSSGLVAACQPLIECSIGQRVNYSFRRQPPFPHLLFPPFPFVPKKHQNKTSYYQHVLI